MESNTQNTQGPQLQQPGQPEQQKKPGPIRTVLGQFATGKYWKEIFSTVMWSLIAGFFVALGSVFVSLGNTKLKERVNPQSLSMIQYGMGGNPPQAGMFQNQQHSQYQNMQSSFHQQSSFNNRQVTGGFGTPPANPAPHPATQFTPPTTNNFTFISPKSPLEGGSPFPT